jgi:hypothetical protein
MKALKWIVVGVVLAGGVSALAGVAEISEVKGEATVFSMTGPGWLPAQKGMSLEAGDNLKTAGGSSVSVQWNTGPVVTLRNEGQVAVKSDEKITLFGGYITVQKETVSVHNTQNGDTTKLLAGQSIGNISPELIDDKTLEIETVFYKADLADSNCFSKRDGRTQLRNETAEGEKVAKVTLGDGAAIYNSRWFYKGEVDLNRAPWMDLRLRTETEATVSILLQVGDDTKTWHQIPILKKHHYQLLDGTLSGTKTVNDGQWHRLSWNLKQMVQKKFGADASTVRDIMIGKWADPELSAELEIKSFILGAE